MYSMEVTLESKKEDSLDHFREIFLLRERFYTRLTLVSNVMSFIAVLSIILMIIANELTFNQYRNQQTKASWSIELIITMLTFILIIFIIYYHYLMMICYAYKNRLHHWSIELTLRKILWIMLEILICSIHPFPRAFPKETNSAPSTSVEPYPLSYVSVDVALSLPMFLRLYLLGRTIMLYSPAFRNVVLRSFGYMNHVSINISFLLKSYLEQWPTRCLATFLILFFFIGSWSLRACNYRPDNEHISMPDAMWLFIITATTVGYGDLYPSTYCGRAVAAIVVLIGLLQAALLIAILSNKLLLSREQKYVHTFLLNNRLRHEYKHQAANIIKFAIKLWYLKQNPQNSLLPFVYFHLEQKLFRAIKAFQLIKRKQANLVGCCTDLNDIMTAQQDTSRNSEQTNHQIEIIQADIKQIQKYLVDLNRTIVLLQRTFHQHSIQ